MRTRLRTPPGTSLRRSRGRAGQRGATLFVIVLVIAMLTGIGMFAARAASVANATSGYDRQVNQAHYVTEYGMLAVVSELTGPRRQWYLDQMVTADPGCTSIKTQAATKTCYRFGYDELEMNLLAGLTGTKLVEVDGLGASKPVADFVIEMSDRAPASEAIPGMARAGDQGQVNMKYWSVTLTATGHVRPDLALNPATVTAANEAMRFHITVGPF
jgi:hypothetical protein